MSRIIGGPDGQNKPEEPIAIVAPYIDTIEASSPRHFHSELLSLVKPNSGSMLVQPIKNRDNPAIVCRRLLKINQPSRHCMELLQRYRAHDPGLSLYRLHIAFDVISTSPSVTREDVIELFANHFHLRYRRGSDDVFDFESTRYSVQVSNRKTRPYRNTALYSGRDSKITGECDAIHFEIRLERKRSVLASGIEDPSDALNIDPAQFFKRHVSIKDHRAILAKIIDRRVKKTIDGYPNVEPAFIERRVKGLHRRLLMSHVSSFAKYYPKQFERLKKLDCIGFEGSLNWASADVECYDNVGKLHCLLPPARKIKRLRLG
ncbi:MAG: hypothetical protein K5821_16430 [Nitrobacter sp.]|uniref:hypothetical protein n=1 Tax=Nitrobacter sp. TaxID=29420 RepID=UPI00260D1AA2|nr:hypothetical protein [Nitrobacter sp.]MCV0387948.1 hypothetical protein [Nitrobacter sp.]